MPTYAPLLPLNASQRGCIEIYKLSLVLWDCWNINWGESHCCQWVIYLALFIKKRRRLKGWCWNKVLDCVADTAVTYGLMWVFICSNCQKYISPQVVCTVQVIVLITGMTDVSPASTNYSAYSLLLIFFCTCIKITRIWRIVFSLPVFLLHMFIN